MKKTLYEKPQLSMELLDIKDIITNSLGNGIPEDGGENDGEWW